MKRIIAVMILLLIIFMTSCMNITEVSKLNTSAEMLKEDRVDFLIRKIPPKPNIVNGIKENVTLDEKKVDKPVKANSVLQQQENITPSYSKIAVVLTYHHISNNPFSGITITPKRFEEDIKMLIDKKFSVISLRELLNAIDGNAELPNNAVVITFDDGIESFYKYAYPLLTKYNMPATEFIITARNENYAISDNELNPLSPEEITEMFQRGLVDIQSHTNNSHDYVYINSEKKKGAMLTNKIYNIENDTIESDEDYLSRITADLTTSREIIFKYTGVYPDMLCFPFGSYNKKVWNVGKSVGFNYFITTQSGYNREGSKTAAVYRIRAGDAVLTSDKLLRNIVDCASGIKKD